MISLDISILYQVVLFIVLLVVLNKILFQPYLTLLDERERRTSGAQQDSVDLEREGAQLRAQYEEKIAQGQSTAGAERQRILQVAREEREKILGQARVERRLAGAEAATIAAEIASKVLGRRVA
jgi:F-type H+-transporting ATPase subunit b